MFIDATQSHVASIEKDQEAARSIATYDAQLRAMIEKIQGDLEYLQVRDRAIKELSNHFLFPNNLEISSHLASRNPINKKAKYGSVIDASQLSYSALLANEQIISHLNLGDGVGYADGIHRRLSFDNVIILGGAVNNLVTRAIMGTGAESKLFKLFKGGRYQNGPPIHFDITDYLSNPIPSEEPEWQLVIDDKKVDLPGELLLITSIPNPFNPEARIVNFSGRHGAGVRAVGNLLSDKSLTNILFDQTKYMSGWQILLQVVTARQGDLDQPVSFGKHYVFEIEDSFEIADDEILARNSDFLSLAAELFKDEPVIHKTIIQVPLEYGNDISDIDNGNSPVIQGIMNYKELSDDVGPFLLKYGVANAAKRELLLRNFFANIKRALLSDEPTVTEEGQGEDGQTGSVVTKAVAATGDRPPLPDAVRVFDSEKQEWSGPEGAPKHYGDAKRLDPTLEIDQHLDRQWGPWVYSAEGLPRTVLKKIDETAYNRLNNWLRDRDHKLPPLMNVPTKKERNDALLIAPTIPAGEEVRVGRMLESRKRRGTPSPR